MYYGLAAAALPTIDAFLEGDGDTCYVFSLRAQNKAGKRPVLCSRIEVYMETKDMRNSTAGGRKGQPITILRISYITSGRVNEMATIITELA